MTERQAHLWSIDAGEFLCATAHQQMWLTAAEREQIARYRIDTDRALHQASRMFLRWMLSQYAPVPPQDWVFGVNDYGKPFIQSPAEYSHLRFNLSHSAGAVAGVVAWDKEAGVDIEKRDRAVEPLQLCDRFFAPAEAADVRAQPLAGQQARFLRFWTLKESYVKARGLGLSQPLDQFAFQLKHPLWKLWVAPGGGEPAEQWRFAAFDAGARHFAALCVQAPGFDLLVSRYCCGPDLQPRRAPLAWAGHSAGIIADNE